jgi:hypothetical protein
MDDMLHKVSMLDKFIENERKSRQRTLVIVVIMIVLCVLVFWLSFQLNSNNAKYKTQNVELLKMQVSLEKEQLLKDSLISRLVMDSTSLEGFNINLDSVKSANETIKVLFNRTLATFTDNKPEVASERMREICRNYFPKNPAGYSESLIKSVLISTNSQQEANPDISINLLYMPEYKVLKDSVNEQLKKLDKIAGVKIFVLSPILITEINFNNSVRYFDSTDKKNAIEITRYLNKQNSNKIEKQFVARLVAFKAPLHKIEIWIGENKPKELNIFFD